MRPGRGLGGEVGDLTTEMAADQPGTLRLGHPPRRRAGALLARRRVVGGGERREIRRGGGPLPGGQRLVDRHHRDEDAAERHDHQRRPDRGAAPVAPLSAARHGPPPRR
ncbi:hypothetical protein GCM10022227_10860 [Streptomyces sedi]